jgi:hypothetical protein
MELNTRQRVHQRLFLSNHPTFAPQDLSRTHERENNECCLARPRDGESKQCSAERDRIVRAFKAETDPKVWGVFARKVELLYSLNGKQR